MEGVSRRQVEVDVVVGQGESRVNEFLGNVRKRGRELS